MRPGQSIRHLRGSGPPLLSDTLAIAALARACGIAFSSDKSLLDTIQNDGDNGTGTAGVKRSHVWTFDGDGKANFNVPQGTQESGWTLIHEELNLDELATRFRDDAWCNANPDHPITHARAMWDQIVLFRTELRDRKPALKLEKVMVDGDTTKTITVIIPADATGEERAEYLAHYEEAIADAA